MLEVGNLCRADMVFHYDVSCVLLLEKSFSVVRFVFFRKSVLMVFYDYALGA